MLIPDTAETRASNALVDAVEHLVVTDIRNHTCSYSSLEKTAAALRHIQEAERWLEQVAPDRGSPARSQLANLAPLWARHSQSLKPALHAAASVATVLATNALISSR